ncbi:hypothetical protein [Erwinia psidii]|nr:hypothetical protein [Erwinia psidii]
MRFARRHFGIKGKHRRNNHATHPALNQCTQGCAIAGNLLRCEKQDR